MGIAGSKRLLRSIALASLLLVASWGSISAQAVGTTSVQGSPTDAKTLVTFIELGSVNCVPCKAMRPVMTDIETSYEGRVKVLFYDVWTERPSPMAGSSAFESYRLRSSSMRTARSSIGTKAFSSRRTSGRCSPSMVSSFDRFHRRLDIVGAVTSGLGLIWRGGSLGAYERLLEPLPSRLDSAHRRLHQ